MIWLIMFVGFCIWMAERTSEGNGEMSDADMYLPQELRRRQNGRFVQEQLGQENDWFMQEQFRQQNEQFMNDSMKFSMDSVTPFEHGGFNMDFGNSFNDFGAGGFFDGGFGGFGF